MSTAADFAVNAQEQLVSDIKSAISEAEDMLDATSTETGDKVATLRARIQDRLKAARARLVDAEDVLRTKSRAAAKATDEYVHESPWTAISIAAGVGLVIGLALGRR